jgi:hypothetical protein
MIGGTLGMVFQQFAAQEQLLVWNQPLIKHHFRWEGYLSLLAILCNGGRRLVLKAYLNPRTGCGT